MSDRWYFSLRIIPQRLIAVPIPTGHTTTPYPTTLLIVLSSTHQTTTLPSEEGAGLSCVCRQHFLPLVLIKSFITVLNQVMQEKQMVRDCCYQCTIDVYSFYSINLFFSVSPTPTGPHNPSPTSSSSSFKISMQFFMKVTLPILAVILLVILIIVLVVSLLICKHKKQNNKKEEEEETQVGY